MDRITRDMGLMRTAEIWSMRGTCGRLKVGAVFSIEGRILAQGYNGAPAGLPHCQHSKDTREDLDILACRAQHAEMNGVAWAARKGVKLEGCELHVTDSPCLSCAMTSLNAGVLRVVYMRPYRLTAGVDLLASAGVEVVDFQSLIA